MYSVHPERSAVVVFREERCKGRAGGVEAGFLGVGGRGCKRGRQVDQVDTRMQRRLQQIANLPPEERRQIILLVDAFVERA